MTLDELFDLAIDHHRAGRLVEAAGLYRQILGVDPLNSDALWLLGRVELQQGRANQAADLLRRAIAANPAAANLHNSLGDALKAQGQVALAAAAYCAAVQLEPDDPLGHCNLANLRLAERDFVAAEAGYRAALRLKPDAFELYNNLGVTLREQRRWAEARECFATALRLKPDCAEAESNLGNVLCDEGHNQEGLEAYRRALKINPLYTPAHFNLGNSLKRAGRLAEALAAYQRAAELEPADAEARTNLGALLNATGQLDEAVDECRQAVALKPDFALAHNNLASCLHARGQIEEAIAHYRRAAELNPDDPLLSANLAHALLYAPGVDAQVIFAEHRRWGLRHADPLPRIIRRKPPDRAPGRRLRVGYVSAHFREHAIGVFTEPMLGHHDHDQFEVFCYSDVGTPDRATSRFQASADRWIDITRQSDAQLAEQIAADEVDILVDLTGHLEGNRLLAFARKPAPIQVTYLGYQTTTGMAAMDYRLTDEWSDPPGMTEQFHTERLVRLPRAFFCYRPSDESPEVNELPALAAGRVTFGSFNKLAKVTCAVLTTWGRILARVPESRLLVLAEPSAEALRRMREAFGREGVSPERVEFVAKRPRAGYLRLHHEVDIALDAFPFNGHTTLCEALWMGVPVMMLAGATYVTRFGGTALVNLELADLIATTDMQYIEIATRLASDLGRLRELRGGLRRRMLASPLLDAAGFTRHLEHAYRSMWKTSAAVRSD